MTQHELDELDSGIVTRLRVENMSNNALAEELGISEGTVRQRIKKLKEAGVLKIRALINPDSLVRQQLATIAVNLNESRLLDAKAREIAELENVLSVSITSGQYDLIVEVLVDSNRGLVGFLTDTLARVEGIAKTESFLMLKNYNKYV
ncbi:Lrp/AsnC family transcriptional regulator [Marispirochaeta sp.]|jgi:Lrp/AsnC family transcriptional regulator, regulator for asnA, asnC and gidA|uniref:Lrp/AsnC family transcriptional regulator n=1 Tax=Marispirochaeta sp. TaxID=2038653 RepID=UPI0029C8FA60|nr:Lrp/AsnC family transcriptional regulator [Marispirochaeta sp.]